MALCCHCLFLLSISPSFGASRGVCFVTSISWIPSLMFFCCFFFFKLNKEKHELHRQIMYRRTCVCMKTQISLRSHIVWSKFSMPDESLDPSLAIHIEHTGSDQTTWICRLIWIFAGRTCPTVLFSRFGSYNQQQKKRDIWVAGWHIGP